MKIDQAELETMILGMMMTHRDSATKALCAGVTADCFTQKFDQEIFETIKSFALSEGKYGFFDIKAKLDPRLHARCELIRSFDEYFPNHDPFIAAILDRHWANRVNREAGSFHALVNGQTRGPSRKSIRDGVLKLSEAVLVDGSVSKGKSMRDIYIESVTALETNIELRQSGKGIGIQTPYKKLNDAIYGLLPGRLYIVAARPGVGKTTFALNLVSHACKMGKHVTFVSLEMKAAEIHQKLVSENGKILNSSIARADMNEHQLDKFMATSLAMKDWNFKLFDDNRTFEDIKIQTKLDKLAGKIDVLFIDYLTLMDSSMKHEGIRHKIIYMTKALKQMAMVENIPVVVLAQLNRNIEKGGKQERRPPMLSDLKESGSIEQDADVVMFVDRPAMYDDDAPKNQALLYLEKNRTGATGDMELYAAMDISSFLEKE